MRSRPSTAALWMRREVAANELRTPLVPNDAVTLLAAGVSVSVEEADQRAFPIEEYARVGCRVVPGDSWTTAPPDTVVLGLKEPSSAAARELSHRHVFFGHAYKDQIDGSDLLRRFYAGCGTLLDLETLVDAQGRRVAAFGYWAGYVGAALAVLHHRNRLKAPLHSMARNELDNLLRGGERASERSLVIGALGRSGRGACEALAVAGSSVTEWDVAQTRELDTVQLLDHDVLVNAIFAAEPGAPFLTDADLPRARKLTTVSDVTCDVTSACNRLPINEKITTWAEPVRRLHSGPPALDVLAIE